jgi:hypothetical protein
MRHLPPHWHQPAPGDPRPRRSRASAAGRSCEWRRARPPQARQAAEARAMHPQGTWARAAPAPRARVLRCQRCAARARLPRRVCPRQHRGRAAPVAVDAECSRAGSACAPAGAAPPPPHRPPAPRAAGAAWPASAPPRAPPLRCGALRCWGDGLVGGKNWSRDSSRENLLKPCQLTVPGTVLRE